MAQNKNVPEGQYPITKEDKEKIVVIGRELNAFLLDYAQKNGVDGKFPIKLIVGAFEYVMTLHGQKSKLLGDDFLIAQHGMEQYGLGDKIEEPFTEQEYELPSIEERRAQLTKMLADLDAEQAEKTQQKPEADAAPEEQKIDEEVADASLPPSNVSIPAEPQADAAA